MTVLKWMLFLFLLPLIISVASYLILIAVLSARAIVVGLHNKLADALLGKQKEDAQ